MLEPFYFSHKKAVSQATNRTILFMLLDKSYKTAGSKCNNFKIQGSASLLQVVIMAIMAMLPFSPWGLSDRAYRFTLVGTGFSCSYSIYSIYGRPRAWNLQAIQLWLQSLIATKDFIYLLYCFVFVSSPMAIKFALVPVLCRSLELVAKFLRRNFSSANLYRKYVEDPCLWIDTNTATLNILSSNSEIMLGFLVIILLFTRQRKWTKYGV